MCPILIDMKLIVKCKPKCWSKLFSKLEHYYRKALERREQLLSLEPLHIRTTFNSFTFQAERLNLFLAFARSDNFLKQQSYFKKKLLFLSIQSSKLCINVVKFGMESPPTIMAINIS
jgi:hypothetical protein